MVIGKPSQTYFRMVLDDLGIPLARVAVIGDDIEIDVRGAQVHGHAGLAGQDRPLPQGGSGPRHLARPRLGQHRRDLLEMMPMTSATYKR